MIFSSKAIHLRRKMQNWTQQKRYTKRLLKITLLQLLQYKIISYFFRNTNITISGILKSTAYRKQVSISSDYIDELLEKSDYYICVLRGVLHMTNKYLVDTKWTSNICTFITQIRLCLLFFFSVLIVILNTLCNFVGS